MQRNVVPRTDVTLPAVSFGAGTAAGLLVTGDRADQIDAIRTALDGGINHFDTAAIYGSGASEVNLGAVLKDVGADVLVTSKFNVTPEFLSTRDFTTCVTRSVQASLSRLQRDHLDFLLVHNPIHRGHTYRSAGDPRARLMAMYPPITLDDYLGDDGLWEAIAGVREAGIVRHIGLGGMDSDPRSLRSAIASGLIEIFQQSYHLLNPSAALPPELRARGELPELVAAQDDSFDFEDVIDFADSQLVGTSVISPLAAGVLTDDAARGRPAPGVSQRERRFPLAGQFEAIVSRAEPLRRIARDAGLSTSELAYRFVLSTPGVTTVVGGFSTTKQVAEAIGFADRGVLPPDVLSAIHQAWNTVPGKDNPHER